MDRNLVYTILKPIKLLLRQLPYSYNTKAFCRIPSQDLLAPSNQSFTLNDVSTKEISMSPELSQTHTAKPH